MTNVGAGNLVQCYQIMKLKNSNVYFKKVVWPVDNHEFYERWLRNHRNSLVTQQSFDTIDEAKEWMQMVTGLEAIKQQNLIYNY